MSASMKQAGVLGLGLMGRGMARRLLAEGWEVRVWNRTPGRAGELVGLGAVEAPTPRAAVTPGGIVITMVSDDAALLAVSRGPDGVESALREGTVHLSMSTVSPEVSRQLAESHAKAGGMYVAAPVLGRPEAAAAGKLWLMVSGAEDAKKRAEPALEVLGQGRFDFGDDPGAANVVKLAANFMILSAVEAMAEALVFAQKQGVGREQLVTMLTSTVFNCPLYQNYGRLLAAQEFEKVGFRLVLALKDVRLAQAAAEEVAAPMPLAGLIHDLLLSAVARGRGEMDMTATALDVAEQAGLSSGEE